MSQLIAGDRLTRYVAFRSRLLEANVDVRFADFPQIEGATGKFMLHMLASVAEISAASTPVIVKSQPPVAWMMIGGYGSANMRFLRREFDALEIYIRE